MFKTIVNWLTDQSVGSIMLSIVENGKKFILSFADKVKIKYADCWEMMLHPPAPF